MLYLFNQAGRMHRIIKDNKFIKKLKKCKI